MAPLDFNAPTAEEAAEIRRRKAAITRRIKRKVLAELGLDRLPKRGERTLVTGAQGTGKSRTCAESIAELPAGDLSIWWLVPSLQKAEEQAGEYNRLRTTDSRLARVVRGRGALDPRINGAEPMCPRHLVVNRAAAMGVNVQSNLRQRLPAPVVMRVPAPGHGAARGSDRLVPHGIRLPVAALPGAATRYRDCRRVRDRQGDRYREL
jgi:hypothetical protein